MSDQSPLLHALASPDLHEVDIAAAVRVLRSGMLVQGPEVALLETRICSRTGSAHAVAVANGTIAIQLALEAAGIGPGDEVIVPALSYIATANAVVLCGATPVFADVDARTFNLDPALIEAAITPRTRAVLPVHEFGLCCEIDVICAIAAKHNLIVIEDAACALGSLHRGRPAGSFGSLATFSLHPRKIVTCGEGGVITTSSAYLADQLRVLRNHGASLPPRPHAFIAAGHNARLTDFQAALTASQLTRLDETLGHRARLAELYLNRIRHPSLTLPLVPDTHTPNWQTFHLLLDDTLDQARTIAWLRARGIGSNLGAQCMPAQDFYLPRFGDTCPRMFPNAWRAWKKGLAIPLHEKISFEDAAYIAATLNQLTTQ